MQKPCRIVLAEDHTILREGLRRHTGTRILVLTVHSTEEYIHAALDALTQRERETLKLIAEGYRNREIADFLCISVKTVEKHRGSLMKKLKQHNSAALTAFALERGLVRPRVSYSEGASSPRIRLSWYERNRLRSSG